ncbi:ABC transporter permease [Streptomyces sp. RK75]|uniref:ABC transporter permease n=1 Tax=Streptomyces sp. RK75 TaxID=2824895 RepID=UPI001B3914D7|nr:ABC transporter permease [Streptomyces sp. RK75]MBQ0867049.1 ABC transporter permease [Streptomyces sp. RK75]
MSTPPTVVGARPRRTELLRRELRTVHAVVLRDLLRTVGQPVYSGMMLLEPLVFLLALGGGLAAFIPDTAVGGDYTTYLFPGILVMTIQMPTFGVGARLIVDRASGHLRETLMAPAHRPTLLVGMCLGGTTVATAQGTLLLSLAGTAHLPYRPTLLAGLLGVLVLAAFTLTAVTIALAVAIRTPETFEVVLSLAMTPLLFLSGAFFPLTKLPDWLAALAALNPLSYAVDLLHRTIEATTSHTATYAGVRWADWTPPALLELALVALLGLVALTAAARRFSRTP